MAATAEVRLQRVLGVAVAAALSLAALSALGRPSDRPAPGAGANGSPRPTGASTSQAASDPIAPAPQPTSGPGVDRPGILVRARPDDVGTLEVVERIRTATPVMALRLTPPSALGLPGLAGIHPAVVSLQAAAGGTGTVPTGFTGFLAPTTLTFTSPTTSVTLRYRLEDASRRSQPAPPGRVLIALPPIASESLGRLPVVVQVSGAGVRNLVCPLLSPGEQLCGRASGALWSTIAMPAARARVVAQVDLPAPG